MSCLLPFKLSRKKFTPMSDNNASPHPATGMDSTPKILPANQTIAQTQQHSFSCMHDGSGAYSTAEEWKAGIMDQKLPDYTECEALYRPEVAETIESCIDSLSADLRTLSLKIHGM